MGNRMKQVRLRVCSFLVAASAAAAQGTLTGPSLGLVYDPGEQAIRPILGIPGASTAGPKIDTGFAIAAAAIGPSHDYALAVSTDGTVNLVTFGAAGASSQAVGAAAAPDRMVLSPSGSAAILYYKGAAALQVVTGLPGAVQVGSPLDLSSLPQAPGTLAVCDDGTIVLAGVGENSPGDPPSGAVFVIPGDGSAVRSIAVVQHASAMAFYARSHDVLIADDAAGSITMVSDAAGQANTAWAFSDPGLLSPDSVQAAADGRTILAGSSTSSVLSIIDPSGTNAPVFLPCQCAPMELRPFKPAAIYQITEPGNGLLWILDSNAANPRVLFVPVPSDGDGSGSGQ